MPSVNSKLPRYCFHKASKQGIVRLGRKVHYLGKHDSPESWTKYHQKIAEWLAGQSEHPTTPADDFTIIEVIAAFRRHALQHYRKDGQPTGAISKFDQAAKPLLLLYGDLPAREFAPLKLKAVRSLMVNGFTDGFGKLVPPLSRGVVNSRVGAIRQIFRWAESEELVPANITHTLATVAGLQAGRTEARETKPVGPVDEAHVEATLPHLPSIVADMVRIQRLTGCRPGEVCLMRPFDIDRKSNPWVYRPASHKTEHHGRARVIYIGPKAQDILRKYLPDPPGLKLAAAEDAGTKTQRDKTAYCFVPAESEQERNEKKRANRKTPMTPSHERRRRKRRPARQPGDRYTKDSYGRAVRRACRLADRQAHADDPSIPGDQRIIPDWAPNRLRHAAATEIRKRFDLEAARVVLGHSKADVTQVYAERDQARALEVMRQIG